MMRRPPRSPLFPYPTLFQSITTFASNIGRVQQAIERGHRHGRTAAVVGRSMENNTSVAGRSEEHTSELQSRQYLVCRLLLEKKNTARVRVGDVNTKRRQVLA